MDKHTFKVGDRVKSVGYVNSRARGDEYGKVVEVMAHGVGVKFDRNVVNRPDGRWYLRNNEAQHDTNFQVGDWVRYEGVVENYIASLEGHVGTITEAHSNSARVQFPGITDVFLTANLVKIQPPQIVIRDSVSYHNKSQEAHVDKVKIKHRVTGAIISDVTESPNPCEGWVHLSKDGSSKVVYYREYWEPLTEWVTIQVEKEGWSTMNTYCLVYGPRGARGDECTQWRYPQ